MEILLKQAAALLSENDLIAALGNFSALIYYEIPDLNWVGFYRLQNEELVLGPFNGKVACTHLKLDHGVCAKAVNDAKITIVNDVHAFKGHIACDTASSSELVLPLHQKEKLWGVLDVDSPKLGRFDDKTVSVFKKLEVLLNDRISDDVHLRRS